MIALGVNFPNIYGVHTVESHEMLYFFSLKHSHFTINEEGPNNGSTRTIHGSKLYFVNKKCLFNTTTISFAMIRDYLILTHTMYL